MKPAWPLTLFYDGDCPLCAREILHLRRHADSTRLQLVDVTASDFEADSLGMMTAQQFKDLLHARFADGTWVKGLDATYWSWRAAGLGHWAAPLAWKPLRPLFDLGYRLFLRFRPQLAWIPHPEGGKRCSDGQCAIASKPKSAK
jgi:predicted DCC family thiol-disulfide oxidoreductase YuxK